MSQRITITLVAVFGITNVGIGWIVDDCRRLIALGILNLLIMIPASLFAWRGIVVYTAKQLAKAEPIIAAALAHLD